MRLRDPSAALVLALLSCPAAAQGERHDFSLRAEKGKAFEARFASTTEQKVNAAGARIVSTTETRTEARVKVVAVEPGGGLLLEIAITRIAGVMKGSPFGELPFDSQSEQPDPRLLRMKSVKGVVDQLTAMAGKTIRAQVDREGGVVVLDEDQRTRREAAVRNLLGLRPKKPIALGESSPVTGADLQEEGTPFTGSGTLTLKEVAEDRGIFEVAAKLELDPAAGKSGSQAVIERIERQAIAGRYVLSRKDGFPIEGSMNVELAVTGMLGMAMDITIAEQLTWSR